MDGIEKQHDWRPVSESEPLSFSDGELYEVNIFLSDFKEILQVAEEKLD